MEGCKCLFVSMSSVAGSEYGLNAVIVNPAVKGGASEHNPATCKKRH